MSRTSRQRWFAGGGGVVLAAALIAGSAHPASADEVSETPELTVDTSSLTITAGANDIGLQLPGELTTTAVDTSLVPDALLAGQGTALLSTAVGSSVLSSFATDDGVQTLVQIAEAGAPAEYRFPLGLPAGGQAALLDDGAVIISDASGAAVGGFRAPWAVDAHGTPVPTSFRIDGDDLVQVIDFQADTVFPVTADPHLGTEWWGYYVQLSRAETKRVATIIANNQGVPVAAGVVCSALPGPAAVGCGAAIALAYFRIIDPVNRANSAGKCVALNYPWLAISNPPVGWTTINATTVNCRR